MPSMTSQPTPRLSDQLRRIVDCCGLSRYEISKRTGIDEAALSRFVHGLSGLSLESIDRLGECFSLTLTGPAKRSKPARKKPK